MTHGRTKRIRSKFVPFKGTSSYVGVFRSPVKRRHMRAGQSGETGESGRGRVARRGEERKRGCAYFQNKSLVIVNWRTQRPLIKGV